MGNVYRGVTKAKVDSWSIGMGSIFDQGTVDAFLKAVGRAAYHGNAVLSASVGLMEPSTSAMASAFDDAYDAGIMAIAAVGNYGAWPDVSGTCDLWPQFESVTSPASAHKAIAVGYYNVKDPDEDPTCDTTPCDSGPPTGDWKRQSLGPTEDGRIKPDILMPTRTETGCALSNSCISTYCHSSGATPYAAAAALLLYNFYNLNGLSASAGKVYASLIGFGDMGYPWILSMLGAGKVKLGDLTSSRWITGRRYVSQDENEEFVFPVVNGTECQLSAAIWWPEEPDVHNDIDLYIYDSNGKRVARSISADSVFEKVRIKGSLSPLGNWRYRIRGHQVSGAGQLVYYFLYYKTGGCP